MYRIKLKDQELYYGGFMCFYESKERGATYEENKANQIADNFRELGAEVEIVPA